MRYSASEKLEIIRLVEQSHLPVRRTLGQIGIPRSTFYRWFAHHHKALQSGKRDRGQSSLCTAHRGKAQTAKIHC